MADKIALNQPIELDKDETTRVRVLNVKPGITELELDDGSIIEMSLAIIDVLRVPERWDSVGHPIYVVNNQVIMRVTNSQDELRKS